MVEIQTRPRRVHNLWPRRHPPLLVTPGSPGVANTPGHAAEK